MEGATHLHGSSAVPPTRRMQFWLAASDGVGRSGPLTMESADGREALCILRFEEGRLFLSLGTRSGWRARATAIGELVSALSGPCRGAELVVLDPLLQREAGAFNRLLRVDRERFVGVLLRKGSGH